MLLALGQDRQTEPVYQGDRGHLEAIETDITDTLGGQQLHFDPAERSAADLVAQFEPNRLRTILSGAPDFLPMDTGVARNGYGQPVRQRWRARLRLRAASRR